MGFAVPAATGARLARGRGRPVVLIGDGSFQMTGMDLSTAVSHGLDPIVLVLDNHGYGAERAIVDGPFNDVAPWDYTAGPRRSAPRGDASRPRRSSTTALGRGPARPPAGPGCSGSTSTPTTPPGRCGRSARASSTSCTPPTEGRAGPQAPASSAGGRAGITMVDRERPARRCRRGPSSSRSHDGHLPLGPSERVAVLSTTSAPYHVEHRVRAGRGGSGDLDPPALAISPPATGKPWTSRRIVGRRPSTSRSATSSPKKAPGRGLCVPCGRARGPATGSRTPRRSSASTRTRRSTSQPHPQVVEVVGAVESTGRGLTTGARSGGGTTPSCCIMTPVSVTPQCSAARPPRKRTMSTTGTLMRRPVGRDPPMNSPSCVPSKRQ